MTDQIFIERSLAMGRVTLNPSAIATVVGEWYFWFPPSYHRKQMAAIVEFFEVAAKVAADENNATLFWKNYSVMLDLFVATVSPGFVGTTDVMCNLSTINGKHAHCQMVWHSSGFVAARVQHFENEGTRRRASLEIDAEIMHLGQLFSTHLHRPAVLQIPVEDPHLSDDAFPSSVIKPAPEIKIAKSQLVLAGYFYKTTKYFADSNMYPEYNDSSRNMLLTRTYYTSKTQYQKYSLLKRIWMFLTRRAFMYYDENTGASLV